MADTSVVMATYNGAKYVAEQIASLLRQTTPPAELVVADDQSSDDTVKIVTEALRSAPFRVRIERNAERKGYRRNFTEAASLCSAPLIAFCDQDDVWQPNKLARMERVFADPAVLLAYHDASITDERGQIVGRLYGPTGGRKRSESSLADPWSFSLGFTQVFRRELVAFTPLHASSTDFLFPAERLAHDQWFFFLASCLGRVAFVDEDLVAYRQHDSNVFSAVDRGRARPGHVLKATLDHSAGQIEARAASVTAKAAILSHIAADETLADKRRATALSMARYHDDLAALYADRMLTYGKAALGKTAAWIRLLAARRRLAAQGLSYPLRHAARDLAFGVLLGRFAKISTVRPP